MRAPNACPCPDCVPGVCVCVPRMPRLRAPSACGFRPLPIFVRGTFEYFVSAFVASWMLYQGILPNMLLIFHRGAHFRLPLPRWLRLPPCGSSALLMCVRHVAWAGIAFSLIRLVARPDCSRHMRRQCNRMLCRSVGLGASHNKSRFRGFRDLAERPSAQPGRVAGLRNASSEDFARTDPHRER